MNPLNHNDSARGTALDLSQRLGTLAAELPAARPEAIATQPATSLHPRLASIVARLHKQFRRQQDAADTLRANEFIRT